MALHDRANKECRIGRQPKRQNLLTTRGTDCIPSHRFTTWREANAQVAELVDALASGASGRKAVEVRVFSWAPPLFLHRTGADVTWR